MQKVSVIIPVYNVEGYLSDCLESVLRQTYENFEVILINDGSTDGSEEICRSYGREDRRIRFFNNTNQGVSATRNYGVRLSVGELITFVDADDVIDKRMIEILVDNLAGSDASTCQISIFETKFEGKQIGAVPLQISGEMAVDELLYQRIVNGPVAKVFRKDKLGKNPFPTSLSVGEDLVANLSIFKKCNQVSTSQDQLYGYRIRQGSVMQKEQSAARLTLIRHLRALEIDNASLRSRLFAEALYILFEPRAISLEANNLIKKLRFSVIRNRKTDSRLRLYAFLSYVNIRLPRYVHGFKNRKLLEKFIGVS